MSSEESTPEARAGDGETDEGEDAQGTKPEGERAAHADGNVGPPEDIEHDPAYSPDDPQLKGIKGG